MKNIVSMLVVFGLVLSLQAQPDGVDRFNFHPFAFDMSLYLLPRQDGLTPASLQTHGVAAFCDQECRGVARLDSLTLNGKTYRYFSLRIYSNQEEGEVIQLKSWDKSGKVFTYPSTLLFKADVRLAYPTTPWMIDYWSSVWIDLSGQHYSEEMAFDVSDNPNRLFLVADGSQAGLLNQGTNVIEQQECRCSVLQLTDGYPFHTPMAFSATSLRYNRVYPTYWSTLFLPYEVPEAQLSGLEVARYVQLNGSVLEFEKVHSIRAYTPYLIRAASLSQTIGEVSAKQVEVPPTAEAINPPFIGTLDTISFDQMDPRYRYYGLDAATGTFVRVGNHVTILPFRAYFVFPQNDATTQYTFRVSETSTAFSPLRPEKRTGTLYDLNGRMLSQPEQVIFIHEGKKYGSSLPLSSFKH